MFEQDRQFSRLVSAQLLIALLAGGAYFLYDQPFESSRTPSGQSPDMFEARLWEDPLSTINNIRDQLKEGSAGSNRGMLENSYTIDREVFINDVRNAAELRGSEGITVLGVMMPEGRNGLSMETRRRIRYAVISALNQSKLPSQSERLPVLNFNARELDGEATTLNLLSYEIYNPYTSTSLSEAGRLPQTVVVLWLPANLMQGDAIAKYQDLLTWIGIEHDHSKLLPAQQTREPGEVLKSHKFKLNNAVLLGPTNSNELADLYRNYALSQRDYVELEDSVDEIIQELNNRRNNEKKEPLSLPQISEILSIIEISHSYLDYGLEDVKRGQVARCISDNVVRDQQIEISHHPEKVEHCLSSLGLTDSEENWPSWVKERWLKQAIARREVASNSELSPQRLESVFDLIDAVDWHLTDGLPDDAAKQSRLARCGINLVNHENLSTVPFSGGVQNFLSNQYGIRVKLIGCLGNLKIEGINGDILKRITGEWFEEEPLEIYLDSIEPPSLKRQLEALLGRFDENLYWGMEFANKLKFLDCTVTQAQAGEAPENYNVNRIDIEKCLRELDFVDSNPDWISAVAGFLPEEIRESESQANQADMESDPYVFPRERIIVLSPRATIPNTLLEEEVGIYGYKRRVLPPQVYRTLDSDEILLTRMIEELSQIRKLNHNDPNVRIALVYEGDGKYGRALQQILNCDSIYYSKTLEKHFESIEQNGNEEKTDKPPCYKNVDSFAYLRGLDGIRSGDNNSTASEQSSASLESIGNFLATSESLEESFGRHQFDYLRRLANEVSRNNYSAIGVLGTDVYDKLLVLQALKEKNQGAVFFTTDLDTTALHGRQFRWTQNLLVASALPLSLNSDVENVQGNSCNYMFSGAAGPSELYAPPFRESYQTAYFQSVCLALNVAENKQAKGSDYIDNLINANLTSQTNIYEVGRTNPIKLGITIESDTAGAGLSLDRIFNANTFRLSAGWLVLMLPVILLALLSGRSWNIERTADLDEDFNEINGDGESEQKGFKVLTSLIKDLLSRRHEDIANAFDRRLPVSWTLGASCILSIVSLIFMIGLLITEALTAGGEPLYILEGISHWPNTLIRIQVLVFCAAFGLYGYARWLKSNRSIDKVLGITEEEGIGHKIRTIAHWIHVIDTANKSKRQKISISEIWRIYRFLGDSKRRWRRVVPRAIFWTAIVLSAFLLTPNPALIRDSFPLADFLFSNWFFFPLTFAALFLISVTNDVTHLCSVFVRALTKYDVEWDDVDSRKLLPNAFGNYAVLCKPLNVLEIIAMRTKAITPLVLFPFGVLVLLVAARSSVFEGWVWSAELILAYALVGANSLYFAMRLQKEASLARVAALNELNEFHTMKQFWESDHHNHFDACVSAAIDYTKAVNKGAFVPWFKHPIFQAVMLPFTGATGMLLLQSI